MSEVKIVATLTPFAEHIETIRAAARAMLKPTHQEAGCLQYDLHESYAIPDVRLLSQQGALSFVFIERWKSEDDLKKHVAMPYHDDFLAILDGKLESISVQRLTALPANA